MSTIRFAWIPIIAVIVVTMFYMGSSEVSPVDLSERQYQQQIRRNLNRVILSEGQDIARALEAAQGAQSDINAVITPKITRCPPEYFPHVSSTKPHFTLCTHGGGDVVSSFFLRDGFWRDCAALPPLLEKVVQIKNVTSPVVVDVGANIGTCALWMAMTGKATVYAFEPFSRNHKGLEASISINNLENRVYLTREGASDTRGPQHVKSEVGNLGNTVMLPQTLTTTAQINVGRRAAHWVSESIRTTLVDDHVHRHVHVMKMDCQGCEIKALKGSLALLDKYGVDVIRSEFDPPLFRAVGDDPKEMLTLLWKRNYTLYDGASKKPVTPDSADAFIARADQAATELLAFAADLPMAAFQNLIH